MVYSIIQPPFTLKFREMSANELKEYRKWFLEVIPSRLLELQMTVNSSPEFENWNADHSRGSIEVLGPWLSRQVEMRPRTSEEIDQIKGRTAFNFDVSAEELTNTTFSLAIDTGMYLGETLRHHYPHLEWHQPLNDKKFADFGQMVLLGFGKATLNPVRIAVTFCYGVANGRQGGKRFGEVYRYWSGLAAEVGKAR
jgi:hypothetical protein